MSRALLSYASSVRWAFLLLLATAACGSDPEPADSGGFGAHTLGSLAEECEGVSGLSGQAILDQRADSFSSTLSYVTAQGQKVNPTDLSVQLAWPDAPAATCYPPYEAHSHQVAFARVAIQGLGLSFVTTDGKLTESLPAKAWLLLLPSGAKSVQVMAVTTPYALTGRWQAPPEYQSFDTLVFTVGLPSQSGVVAVSAQPSAEIDAGVLRGSLAVASFP